jgi:hypothetical protein
MKRLFFIALMATTAHGETVIRQNLPGLNAPDLTARSVIIDGGQVYESVPGMSNVRDISRGTFYIEGNTIVPSAIPGLRSRDFSEPSFSIDEEP